MTRSVARWILAGILATAPGLSAQEVLEVGGPRGPSRVPAWDARGTGPLPWQGIACLEISSDGRFLALGTIAPPGDPNVIVLDDAGRTIRQHRAGERWVGEVALAEDGAWVAAVVYAATGQSGDMPMTYLFTEKGALGEPLRPFGPEPAEYVFHYGDHSNHVPRSLAASGARLLVATRRHLEWRLPGDPGTRPSSMELGGRAAGSLVSVAVSGKGLLVAGLAVSEPEKKEGAQNLFLVDPDHPRPIFAREVRDALDPVPPPEKGAYGPPARPMRDVKLWAPLSVAISRSGDRIASLDVQGWERRVLPRDGREGSLGKRFQATRPRIEIYDRQGSLLRSFGPDTFPTPFWGDLAFSEDGGTLFVTPHAWNARGLAGQPLLPADPPADSVTALDVASGKVTRITFPDAVSDVAVGEGRMAVGCWNGRVYLLGSDLRPQNGAGWEVGGPSLVRLARSGGRIAVATAGGVVRMMDGQGGELWKNDLNETVRPVEKPWMPPGQKAAVVGPGVWKVNSGRLHSDLGNQYVVEAPGGLLLFDPNGALSIEQNWARMKNAGLDPLRIKYVLPSHEHGDHAPGAALLRVLTGAQVVASTEMAYTLQHDMPLTSGYSFLPPVRTDLVVGEDRELDLAGLKVRAVRLPGHTYGSMGYYFEKEGRSYVTIGDLMMPGGRLGYAGSVNFSAEDVLRSLRKLDALKPDTVLGGHGDGAPDLFIGAGIRAGEATGWSKMVPEKPDPLFGFTDSSYTVTAWPVDVRAAAYGDVDGDGRPDVAVLVVGDHGLEFRIHLNKGGLFEREPDYRLGLPDVTSLSGIKLRLAHVGTGPVADFLVGAEDRALLLKSEGGKLAFRKVELPGLVRPNQLLTGDFNGDGRTDLLVAQRFAGGFAILYQDEHGGFGAKIDRRKARNDYGLELVDVNGDGRADVVTAGGEIFLRAPDGSLPVEPDLKLKVSPGSPGWLATGDFNGDGRTDLVFLDSEQPHLRASVYYNTGDPKAPFRPEPDATLELPWKGHMRDGPVAGDVNGDGIADLVLCPAEAVGTSANEVAELHILRGSRPGGLSLSNSFRVKLDYALHYDTRVGLVDLEGKGRISIAGFGPSKSAQATGVYIRHLPPPEK